MNLNPIFNIFLLLFFLLISCGQNKNESKEAETESKSIELCKTSTIKFKNIIETQMLSMQGLNENSTWLDYANKYAKNRSKETLKWSSNPTKESDIFLVHFKATNDEGLSWEVNLKTETVLLINDDEYLKRKYKFTRLDKEKRFTIDKIYEESYNIQGEKLIYKLKADIRNNSNKYITSAKLRPQVIFISEGNVTSDAKFTFSFFNQDVSTKNPWGPNETRTLDIKTGGLDKILLKYKPEFVNLELELIASDPSGFMFDFNIYEKDLIKYWE